MKTNYYVDCPKCSTKHYLDEIDPLPENVGVYWDFGYDIVHFVCPETKEKTSSMVLGYNEVKNILELNNELNRTINGGQEGHGVWQQHKT